MTKIGLVGLLTLASTSAFAGSLYEIPINGGVARIRISEKCREAICASVSWSEHGSKGERREFKIPRISSKTISKMIEGRASGWGFNGSDDNEEAETPPRKSRRATDGKRKSATAPTALRAPVAEQGEPADEPAPASNAGAAPAPSAASVPGSPSAPAIAAIAAPAPSAPSSVTAAETAAAPSALSAAVAPVEPVASPSAPSKAADPGPVAPAEAKLATVASPPASRAAIPRSPHSPVGEWLVENGEGQIRIEECGANLCGYISVAKNPNDKDRKNPDPALRGRSVIGTPVLIDMKRSGNRWNGRVYNVKDGKSYTAHISLKGADTLRVEGCAFGGLVCGGQDWSRVN